MYRHAECCDAGKTYGGETATENEGGQFGRAEELVYSCGGAEEVEKLILVQPVRFILADRDREFANRRVKGVSLDGVAELEELVGHDCDFSIKWLENEGEQGS